MLLKAQTLLKLISITDLFYIRAKIDIATLLFRNHLQYIKLKRGQKHKLSSFTCGKRLKIELISSF